MQRMSQSIMEGDDTYLHQGADYGISVITCSRIILNSNGRGKRAWYSVVV